MDINATTPIYPDVVLDYERLGEEKLNVFSQLDVRIDKKWNFNKLALNLFFEVQNVLFQEIPEPPQFGLSRNTNGMITEPRSLVQIEPDNNSPIPVIGIVLDF